MEDARRKEAFLENPAPRVQGSLSDLLPRIKLFSIYVHMYIRACRIKVAWNFTDSKRYRVSLRIAARVAI
jgi:hypothetical protein